MTSLPSVGITSAPSLFTSTPSITSAPLSLLPTTSSTSKTEPAKVPVISSGISLIGVTPVQKKEETKSMTMSQLDNFLNIWAVEVRDSESTFHNQVSEINDWDIKLISNSDKLTLLNEVVQKLKNAQANINYNLDFVACHLTELNDYLTDLEKKSNEDSQNYAHVKIDTQRRHLYDLILGLDVEIKRIYDELNELIESMNMSFDNTENLNPVTQIGSILNSHVSSLHLIDKNIEKTQLYLNGLTEHKERLFH